MKQSFEIWNEILERVTATGEESLKPAELIIYRVNRLLCDMEMGGFLYNISPNEGPWTELRATADAVQEIGVLSAATTLRQLAVLLEEVGSESSKTWGEYLAHVGQEQVETLEANLSRDAGELWDRLEAFTVSHCTN